MKTKTILLAAVVAALMVLSASHVFAAPLPVTTGLLYQLDASDPGKVSYDGSGNVTSWAQSAGSVACTMVPDTRGLNNGWTPLPPTYSPTGGGNNNLPYVNFAITTSTVQKLMSTGGSHVPPGTVFIMQKTIIAKIAGNGGMWGRRENDKGIRFWNDNGNGTHQLIGVVPRGPGGGGGYEDFGYNNDGANGKPAGYESYYWSDATVFDQQQAWQTPNWGTIGAIRYNGTTSTWLGTALGNYYEYWQGRSWGGQIGEVIVYDYRLTDAERQAVEQYLTDKWLVSKAVPEPAGLGLIGLALLAVRKRRS